MTEATPAHDLTERVKRYLDEEDRSYSWLARQSGIPYNTLRRQIDRPELLSFMNAVRIGCATGVYVKWEKAA